MEKETKPRIGVFLCHCGVRTRDEKDFSEIVRYTKTLPDVIVAEEDPYFCSQLGIEQIKESIKENRLNRVVIAACSPRIIAKTFIEACQEANINRNLICFSNIREQCFWVHLNEPQEALQKAKDMIRMAVAGIRNIRPYTEEKIKMHQSAMIIGAGVAGMTCALSLANQGLKVYVIEKEPAVGGLLNKIYKLYPTNRDAAEVVKNLYNELLRKENVEFLLSSTVKNVKGYVGNFTVELSKGRKESKLTVGAIVIATGSVALEPVGFYGYGKIDGVVTQLEFEELLRNNQLKKPSAIAMIQCVGDRMERDQIEPGSQCRAYCSRVCCMAALKNSVLIKEMYPDTDVYIFYRDIQSYGKNNEAYHLDARAHGLKFVEYFVDNPPEVTNGPNGQIIVKAYHNLLGEEVQVETDLVILSTPLIPQTSAEALAKILKVPLDPDGFFNDYRVKMRPAEFMIPGIYVCGTAQGPKDVNESIIQAYAASSRAAITLSKGMAEREGVAVVDEDLCIGCGTCIDLCIFNAHVLEAGKSKVIEACCLGCGTCAAGCPRRAINMTYFTDDQVIAEIKEAFAE